MSDDEGGDTRDGAGLGAGETEQDRAMSTSETPEDDGAIGRGAANFDPTPYLRQLRGRGGQGQDYLDVKWRLLWLRREHPDAAIITEHVRIDEASAIFKATVSLPTGGRATGYGSETAGDFADFIEKAETKAIGRALNALGYGAQFAEEADETAPIRPGGGPPTPANRPAPPSGPRAPSSGPPSAPTSPAGGVPPIDFVSSRDRVAGPSAAPGPAPTPAARPPARASDRPAAPVANPARSAAPPPPGGGDPDLADYSWSAVWSWARKLGYNGRAAVEELIGRPVEGLSPAELRDLVQAARGDE